MILILKYNLTLFKRVEFFSFFFSENTPSIIAELETAPSSSILQEIRPEHNNSVCTAQDASFIDHNRVATILCSMDKMKQRVAVERAAEIPLSKTIRSIRTLKSVQKTSTAQPCTEDSRSSSYRIKLSTTSTSRKSTSEQRPINKSPVFTTQLSATSTSTSRKTETLEQTSSESKNIPSKSSVQSGKSFTTITTKEAVIKRRNGILLTSKADIACSKTIKTTSSRKPRSSTPGISLPNVTSTKNTTSIRMPKKSATTYIADTDVPCTSNSSTENLSQRSRAANAFVTLANHEQKVIGSHSFWEKTCRSTHPKSIATPTKIVLHSHENTTHLTAPTNHDPSSSKLGSTASRPKSAPQRTLAVIGATPLARTIPQRSSPSTQRRPVRGITKSGPQVPVSTSVATPNPHNKTMKRADSCSTASRPLLIKTGTVSRPRWK